MCPADEEEWPSLQEQDSSGREVEILPEMAYYGRLQASVQVQRRQVLRGGYRQADGAGVHCRCFAAALCICWYWACNLAQPLAPLSLPLPQKHLVTHQELLPPELSGLVRLPFQKIGHKGAKMATCGVCCCIPDSHLLPCLLVWHVCKERPCISGCSASPTAGVAYALVKEAARHYGLALNCGRPLVILMGGPSGHGKTLMARQLAGE